MNGAALPVFPNYTQLPSHVPIAVWHGLRVLSVAAAIGLGLLLIVRPQTGLFVLWQLVIPIVPAVFLLAPGLWRNVCPLAALNQLPRLAGFTKGLAHSPAIREYSFIVGIVGFFALVSSRKLLFNGDGMATAILLFGALGLAFVGGVLFRGKSGWCSSVCPMLPVQRLYGQTPFVTVPNSHCRPCVGCTKNCYDFNPKVAYLADQYDDDRRYVGFRRFFAAVFPGFVLAFYLVPDPPVVTVERMYLEFAAYMAASLAAFTTLETFAKVRANTLTALFAAAAFNIYYWFAAEKLVAAVSELVQATPAPPWTWAIRGAVLAVTLVWFARTLGVEKRFVALSVDMAAAAAVRLGEGAAAAIERAATRESAQVAFKPEGKRVAVQPGQTLLAVTEQCGLAIESGCRMGICGADPVAVLEGMEHLSAQGEDEKATLARLGLADNTRLACCARVSGPVSVSLTPQRRAAPRSTAPPAARHDASVRHSDRDRPRDRRGHRRRPCAANPSRLRGHRRRQGEVPALQPHGHYAADLRPLGDAGPVSASGGLVRGQPDLVLAQHACRPHRPRRTNRRARDRGDAVLRPAHPRDRQREPRAHDPRLRRRRHVRPARGRGRDVHPRLCPRHECPERGRRRRRTAGPRGRVRALEARAARDGARARALAAAAPGGRARRRVPARLPRGARHPDLCRGDGREARASRMGW